MSSVTSPLDEDQIMWQSSIIDLSEEVRNQPPRQIVGREKEVRDVIIQLGVDRQSYGDNFPQPVLVAPKGAGKSAVIYEVIRRFLDRPPHTAPECHFFRCREVGLVDFDTFSQLLDGLNALTERVVLYLPDMPRLAQEYWPLYEADKVVQFQFLTKTVQRRDQLTIVSEMRPEQYTELIEKDPWTQRRYRPIRLADLSAGTAFTILAAKSNEPDAEHSTAAPHIPNLVLRRLVDRAGEFLPGVLLEIYNAVQAVAKAAGRTVATDGDLDLVLAERRQPLA
jgi:hypothetical protein